MPLTIEIRDDAGHWRLVDHLTPGEPPSSLSHQTSFGSTELYLFLCEPDDSSSSLLRARAGVGREYDATGVRAIVADGYELIRTLVDGQSLERSFLTSQSRAPRHLRFSHTFVDLGERQCLICDASVPTRRFGRHVISEHGKQAAVLWPGGEPAMVHAFRTSLEESIRRARGYPKLIENLRRLLADVARLQSRLN